MGGSSSRFDQTQWWNADGELSSEKESGVFSPTIIPNIDPTAALEIFDILKSKSITSQRDFEVRDGKKNVVYITRAVPGTLAWFDVLKPGMPEDAEIPEEDEGNEEKDDPQSSWGEDILSENGQDAVPPPRNENSEQLLLRVQAEWSRRTWVIYSYTPVFPGQLPADLQDRKGISEGLRLYKSCCITLSWSRSLALATRYGPPTKLQDFWEEDDMSEQPIEDDEMTEKRDSDFISNVLFTKANTIAAKARKEHNVDDEQIRKAQEQATPTKVEREKIEGKGKEEELGGIMGSLLSSFIPTGKEEETVPQLSKKEKQRLSLEGVVDLDAPVLQCQSVLSTKANFQTRLVTKDDTVKLWMLDDAWKEARDSRYGEIDQSRDPVKNPLAKAMAYEYEIFEKDKQDINGLKEWFKAQYLNPEHEHSQGLPKSPPKKGTDEESTSSDSRRSGLAKAGKSWFSFKMSKSEFDGNTSLSSIGTQEDDSSISKGSLDSDVPEESNKVYGSKGGVVADVDDDPNRKEPLVAHWRWKNTYTTHKMQMHLAKNSDLALHVALSIIVNICRYESWK